jgi:hypothetical protein
MPHLKYAAGHLLRNASHLATTCASGYAVTASWDTCCGIDCGPNRVWEYAVSSWPVCLGEIANGDSNVVLAAGTAHNCLNDATEALDISVGLAISGDGTTATVSVYYGANPVFYGSGVFVDDVATITNELDCCEPFDGVHYPNGEGGSVTVERNAC